MNPFSVEDSDLCGFIYSWSCCKDPVTNHVQFHEDHLNLCKVHVRDFKSVMHEWVTEKVCCIGGTGLFLKHSLQFALSKQHNVVSSSFQSAHATSLQSVIHKTHVIRSHRLSPGFLKQMVVYPAMTALQYGNVSERSSASAPDRISPLLPPFCRSSLTFWASYSSTRALPSSNGLLIISVHTQSCPRVSSYRQANVDTNIKRTAKPPHYSLSPHVPHAQTLPPPYLSVSLSRAPFSFF